MMWLMTEFKYNADELQHTDAYASNIITCYYTLRFKQFIYFIYDIRNTDTFIVNSVGSKK